MKNSHLVEHRFRYIVIAFILLISIIVFALLSFTYVKRFNNTLLEDNEAYLSEVADHIVIYTNTVLSDTRNSLQNTANLLSALPEDQWMMYLEDIVERDSLSYIGYAKRDGHFYASEPFLNTNIMEEERFKKALAGEFHISDIEQKILYDRVISGIVISVPIFEQNEPIGVLSTMLDLSKIDSALKVESFQGKGYSYIINAKGDLILQNKSVKYSNFYKILENVEIKEGNSVKSVQENIKNNKSGLLIYTQFDEERYVYYAPLGINGWTIINIVPRSAITEKTDILLEDLIRMNVIAIALFFLLFCIAGIFWIISQNQKNKAQAKSAFLANMSHEIRTPMNAIMGTSEILRRSNLTKNQEYYVNNIINSAQGLLAIINDILDFSKMESKKMQLIEEPYQLETLLTDITTLATIRIGDKDIYFQMFIDNNVPAHLIGDVGRIKQVLVNIVGNAVKFTEKGYIKVYVSWVNDLNKTYLKIEVIDTGRGIRKQDLSKLFVSFNQVDTHYNHGKEGTGLGLAIAMNLCKMMDGDIQVESEFNKGSKFILMMKQRIQDKSKLINEQYKKDVQILIFEKTLKMREFYEENFILLQIHHYKIYGDEESFLHDMKQYEYDYVLAEASILKRQTYKKHLKNAHPVILLNQQEPLMDGGALAIYTPMFGIQLAKLLSSKVGMSIDHRRIDHTDNIAPLPNVSVLVVDDNELNREIACDILNMYQIKAYGAESGKEALELVQHNHYDLVFMDHMMPDMDGVETMQAMRNLESSECHRLIIIALTANATKEAQQMFIKMGFDDFLAKPIEVSKLQIVLEHYLRTVNDQRDKI